MMEKQKIPLIQAESMANAVIELLAPLCERIEIAGSIRRRKTEVGDIEIVAKPILKTEKDLFGNDAEIISMLDSFDYSMIGKVTKGGSKYKQVELYGGCNLDLFIVIPPAQWGVIFMIRTGSADFSHGMVTRRSAGGKLPSCYSVKDGALWKDGRVIETPNEVDYFSLCGMKLIAPENRTEFPR